MNFELETMTKTKITDVVVLSSKNRQLGDNPGAGLKFSMSASNDALSMFDGFLKSMLYSKSAASSTSKKQKDLDGVEPVTDMPNLTALGMKLGALHWSEDATGYELTIDHGMGGASNVVLAACTISKFKIKPNEGGTVDIDWLVESQDVPEAVFGKLATLKNIEVQITLTAPVVVQSTVV
jgi:hypothetical protein